MQDKMTLQEKINQLPELPVELIKAVGILNFSTKKPIVTIQPHKNQAKPKTPNTPVFATNKSTIYHKRYFVQVIYPKVVCEPALEPTQIKDAQVSEFFKMDDKKEGAAPKEDDKIAEAMKERFYKLSTLNGKRLVLPYWCSVKNGPWTAIVQEDEKCEENVPSHWTFQIVDMPEVSIIWDGIWEDMPSYPSLIVIGGTKQFFDQTPECCPGFRECFDPNTKTTTCIRNEFKCENNTPA